jgi:uncharacterized membrane protein YcaP (DUF421 family)
VALNRGVIWLINRKEGFESSIEGVPVQMVKHGRMDPKGLKDARLSREKLFEELRIQGIRHLGELEYVFKEQGGQVSVFRFEDGHSVDGLRIYPPWDLIHLKTINAGDTIEEGLTLGCESCGKIETFDKSQTMKKCDNCGGTVWHDCVWVQK